MSGITISLKAAGRMLWSYFTKPAYCKAMNDFVKDAMAMLRGPKIIGPITSSASTVLFPDEVIMRAARYYHLGLAVAFFV